jgi:hypothetical protein
MAMIKKIINFRTILFLLVLSLLKQIYSLSTPVTWIIDSRLVSGIYFLKKVHLTTHPWV